MSSGAVSPLSESRTFDARPAERDALIFHTARKLANRPEGDQGAMTMSDFARMVARSGPAVHRRLFTSLPRPADCRRKKDKADFQIEDEHRRRVLFLRDRKEEQDIGKKFLMSHRKEINKHHVTME